MELLAVVERLEKEIQERKQVEEELLKAREAALARNLYLVALKRNSIVLLTIINDTLDLSKGIAERSLSQGTFGSIDQNNPEAIRQHCSVRKSPACRSSQSARPCSRSIGNGPKAFLNSLNLSCEAGAWPSVKADWRAPRLPRF